MKKFLGILAIAGVLVACDNTATTDKSADSVKTTTTDSVNSTITTPVVVDSPAVAVDSPAKAVDSPAHK